MEYHDRIYGTVTIEEPVLQELLESQAMQRLQGVLQHGITGLIGVTKATSRFEHSLGAMLLVRRLGAGLEEQIAALLHDVSHTAFSHVIDYVFDNHDGQSFHDEVKEAYIADSDLPTVLLRNGFDWREFVHEEQFPLLEQPAPALCADRLDYFLRDSIDLGLATPQQVEQALSHLIVREGRIMVADQASALWLADTYQAADDASWANFREVGLYELTARALRRALDLAIIDHFDLWQTDEALWGRLQSAENAELQQMLVPINDKTDFVWDDAQPDFRVSTKLRTIDPDVWQGGQARRLSELSSDYARRRAAYLDGKQGKWPMRVVTADHG